MDSGERASAVIAAQVSIRRTTAREKVPIALARERPGNCLTFSGTEPGS